MQEVVFARKAQFVRGEDWEEAVGLWGFAGGLDWVWGLLGER
jgi:hypothetical protein